MLGLAILTVAHVELRVGFGIWNVGFGAMPSDSWLGWCCDVLSLDFGTRRSSCATNPGCLCAWALVWVKSLFSVRRFAGTPLAEADT